ncbi:MAG: DUF4296 domain-containing protein [Flavobacteriia bacterium]|nr:DUF4296 domain-containing protein [Flavobacteriia bacterium]
MKYLGILFIFIISCTTTEIKRFPLPEHLISEKKMVLILKEMTVLEAYVQQKIPNLQQNYKVISKSGKLILKKYQVDEIVFENSMNYYGSRQEKMQEIYSKVLDLVNRDLAKEQAK